MFVDPRGSNSEIQVVETEFGSPTVTDCRPLLLLMVVRGPHILVEKEGGRLYMTDAPHFEGRGEG